MRRLGPSESYFCEFKRKFGSGKETGNSIKKKKRDFLFSILDFRQAQTLVDSAEVDVKVKKGSS